MPRQRHPEEFVRPTVERAVVAAEVPRTPKRGQSATPTPSRMSERQFQAAVMEAAAVLGWLAYHPHDSRHSTAGYPDTTLVHVGQRRIVWLELKVGGRKPTPAQIEWGNAIMDAGGEWYCCWPEQWRDGTVERILRGG